MAIISKGITLSHKAKGASAEWTVLEDLFEIPELGGDVDKIEVTNLMSEAHAYINGIRNYGDSVSFKFYYAAKQFKDLSTLTAEQTWKVALPDGTSYEFDGVPSVKLDGASYNVALTYSLNVAPTSEMKPTFAEA